MTCFYRLSLFILLALSTCFRSFGQSAKVDSLYNLLQYHPQQDSLRLFWLTVIAEDIRNLDRKKATALGVEALQVAKKINKPSAFVRACFVLGTCYSQTENADSGTYYLQLAADIAKKNGLIKWEARCRAEIGYNELMAGNYEEALRLMQEAIPVVEKSGSLSLLGGIYTNMASIFFFQEDYARALEYDLKSFQLFEKDKDPRIVQIISNIGQGYGALGNADSSLYYMRLSIEKAGEFGDSSQVGYSYSTFADQWLEMGNADSAIHYYLRTLDIYKKIGYEGPDRGGTIGGLADALMSKKEYKDALNYYLQSEELLTIANYQDQLENTLKGISLAYAGLGNYQQAFEYMEKYTALHDTLNAVAKSEATAQLERKFSLAQKQKEIELLSKEKIIQQEEAQQQRLLKNIFIGGAAVLLLIAFLLWNRYRLKRRSSKLLEEKNLAIQLEKDRADEQRNRAEQSEKFKSQFLANMSHEIRTPMNAITGITNLLMDEDDEEKRMKYLTAIKKSSENLLVILNDILDLSKLEAGKIELEKIPFRISEPLYFVFETFQLRAKEKQLQWDISIGDDVPPIVLGDPSRLTQVLLNLTGNAMKFTERGSIELKAVMENSTTPSAVDTSTTFAVCFSITDTGIGIPKEKLDAIFQSFTQANPSDNRKYGGTGLGLSISKSLVELMGGNLLVDSTEGIGTTFSFVLSFEAATMEMLQARHQRELTFGEDIGEELAGLRILVAEDNEYNQLLIADTLQKFIPSVEVQLCSNGREVLEKLDHNTVKNAAMAAPAKEFDIILMDIQMPEMDGYETTRMIRKTFKNKIPIIALTASVIRSDIDKCIEAGMNSFVSKPFKESDLLHEIAKIIGRNAGKQTADLPNGNSFTHAETEKNFVDFDYLKSLTANNADKMKKYLAIFLELIPKRIALMEEAIADGDWTLARKTAHTMKPQLSSLGLNACKRLADDIEVNYHRPGKLETDVIQLISWCRKAVTEVEKEIQNFS